MPSESSAAMWFETTNNSIGMVTFATVFYMFCSEMWQLDQHPRTWVRLMIYLDAIAFLISYGGNMADDVLPLCSQKNAYSFVADLVWCMKDAIKYGYITFRSMTICGFKYRQIKLPCYFVAGTSALLYWILMAQVYSFNDSNNCKAHFDSKAPHVLLYTYWTLVDIVAATGIIRKLRSAIIESKLELGDAGDGYKFSILKFREEMRLIFVSISMLAVTIVVIIQTTHPEVPTYRIGTMVFVFCQLFLVIGSKKVAVGGPDSLTGQSMFEQIPTQTQSHQMNDRILLEQNQGPLYSTFVRHSLPRTKSSLSTHSDLQRSTSLIRKPSQ